MFNLKAMNFLSLSNLVNLSDPKGNVLLPSHLNIAYLYLYVYSNLIFYSFFVYDALFV